METRSIPCSFLLGRLTLVPRVVVCHFQAGASEAALDVETLVGFAAVEDGLVAADLLGDEVERLDQAQTQLLALLIFRDGDVFDVTDETEAVDAIYQEKPDVSIRSVTEVELKGQRLIALPPAGGALSFWARDSMGALLQFALDDQGASANNDRLAAAGILNDQQVVAVVLGHPVVALGEGLFGDLADGGQDAQAVEEAGIVVGGTQGAGSVAGGEGGLHLGVDEVGREEALFRHCDR